VELRLVVPSVTVRGVFAMLALDGLVPIYLSLEAALAPGPASLAPLSCVSSSVWPHPLLNPGSA